MEITIRNSEMIFRLVYYIENAQFVVKKSRVQIGQICSEQYVVVGGVESAVKKR
jgi:hypothetical protein